jgi:DNA-binding PucR family transcriptional regulator
VRYRLRRFEQVTKADLRSPWSLAEVCWALRRAELAAPGTGAGPTREA